MVVAAEDQAATLLLLQTATDGAAFAIKISVCAIPLPCLIKLTKASSTLNERRCLAKAQSYVHCSASVEHGASGCSICMCCCVSSSLITLSTQKQSAECARPTTLGKSMHAMGIKHAEHIRKGWTTTLVNLRWSFGAWCTCVRGSIAIADPVVKRGRQAHSTTPMQLHKELQGRAQLCVCLADSILNPRRTAVLG